MSSVQGVDDGVGYGVVALSDTGAALYGLSRSGLAALLDGNVRISGVVDIRVGPINMTSVVNMTGPVNMSSFVIWAALSI